MLYETHWKGLLRTSWEREVDLNHSRRHILQYWDGTPDQHRQTNRLYRQMRIGSAQRELAREKGERSTSPGYDLVSRAVWAKRFSGSVLPIGAFFWYKAIDSLWWLGKVQAHAPEANGSYIVRFLDYPGPVKITLAPPRYNTAAAAPCGSWCLQVHPLVAKPPHLAQGLHENDLENTLCNLSTPTRCRQPLTGLPCATFARSNGCPHLGQRTKGRKVPASFDW